jgi:rfaE bifunctional protein nucleotidyltransferase chain/domain
VLVTALAKDPAGGELATLLADAGVDVVDVGLDGPTPEKVRVCADGRPLLRIDYGGRRGVPGSPTSAARRALAGAAAVLVSDYGRGMTGNAGLRAALADAARTRPLVWDPHPLGSTPVDGTRLATPNEAEAVAFVPGIGGDGLAAAAIRGRVLIRRWTVGGVVTTLGRRGALLVGADGTPLVIPTPDGPFGEDTCGAGDRFATAATAALAAGALPSEAVSHAVDAASRFVAAGGARSVRLASARPAKPDMPPMGADRRAMDGFQLAAAVRAAGGTVVATGGCFDLLHAGHVRALEAARALGDCLIVCLNSDASVGRLKGAGRPLVPESDRAAVLRGLACVDAVEIFDEDTPIAVLERLRPELWAKGADYAVADLPEAAILERWGGQAVVVPYLAGRSTTRLIREASSRDHP